MDAENVASASSAPTPELQRPPLVPEVELYLAGEVMELWGETEIRAGAKETGFGRVAPALLGVRLARRPGAGALHHR